MGTLPKLNYVICNSEKQVNKALGELILYDGTWVEWDTETSGLDHWEKSGWITSIGIGAGNKQYCFPLQHQEGWLKDDFEAQGILGRRLVRYLRRKKTAAHNGKFDQLATRVRLGLYPQLDYDTMLAYYNCDENSWLGLDILANRHFDADLYDIPLKEKHGFGPLKRHCEYLAKDLYYTRKLRRYTMERLNQDLLTKKLFTHLTMPAANKLYQEIEYNGVYINPERIEDGRKYWEERRKNALEKLNKLCPHPEMKYKNKKTKQWVTGVNWGSPQQVAVVLFDELGLKPLDVTPKGARSTSESVLLRLGEKHEVPRLILEWREADKNLGTFITSWMGRLRDGYLHPSFKIWGTVTGRPSCEEPNLQQTPRDARIRSLVDAPPGWTVVDADYSQGELRLAAEYSGDVEMNLAFKNNIDIHTLTCQRMMGIKNPTKEERKKAKAINFGYLYGMWWKKFIIYARDNYGVTVSVKEARQSRIGFFGTYSSLLKYHRRQERYVKMNGFVRSMIGRKRRLPEALHDDGSYAHAEAIRQAINSPIQGMLSDMNILAAIEMIDTFDRSYFRIFATVHDNILVRVRNDKLNYVLPRMKKIMEENRYMERDFGVKLRVPIISEIELGPWGAGKKWEEKIAA